MGLPRSVTQGGLEAAPPVVSGLVAIQKHPGQLCVLDPACAEAIDGHSHKHCVQITAVHDGCVLGHQCLPPVSSPAPLQPQA